MDDFISKFFPNLKQFFVISECKNRKKQRWVLTKEYFQPFETYDDEHSYVLVESTNKEFYLRLKCAFYAAKTGIKEGLLTGFFLGGFWGLLKELNDCDFGFFEDKTTREDEINRKLANRSYRVTKSFEYAQKYTSTTEPISIISSLSKITLLNESLRSYQNISPLDLIMRNSVKSSSEGKYGGPETKSVKSLFPHSEIYSKTNHLIDSLYPEVPAFYERNPFGFRKGREKVEIVGCALIQTTGSLESIKSRSSSDTSDELPKKRKEETKPPKLLEDKRKNPVTRTDNRSMRSTDLQSTESIEEEPGKPVLLTRNTKSGKSTNTQLDGSLSRLRGISKDKKRKSSTNLDESLPKLRHSESYKSTLLINLPENYSFDNIEQVTDSQSKLEDKENLQRSPASRQSRASVQIPLPPDILAKYGGNPRDRRIEYQKKKLPYLVNIDEVGNGYSSDDMPPPTITRNRMRRPITVPSNTSLFLEEIKKLKENLLNEPPYQSSGEISPESSLPDSRKIPLEEKPSESVKTLDSDAKSLKSSKITLASSYYDIGRIKSLFYKRKPLTLEPEVAPRQKKPSIVPIFQKSEDEIASASSEKISYIASSAQPSQYEVTQAPRQVPSPAASTPLNQESEVVPVPKKAQSSTAPVVQGQILQVTPAPRRTQPPVSPTPRQSAPLSALTPDKMQPANVPAPEQPSVAPVPRQIQPSSTATLQTQIPQASPPPRQRQYAPTASPRQTLPSVSPTPLGLAPEVAPTTSHARPPVISNSVNEIRQAQPYTAPVTRERVSTITPVPKQVQPSVAPIPKQTQPSLAPIHQNQIPQDNFAPKQRQLSVTSSPGQTQPSVSPMIPSSQPTFAPTPRKRKQSVTSPPGETQLSLTPRILTSVTPAPRRKSSSIDPTAQVPKTEIGPSPIEKHPYAAPMSHSTEAEVVSSSKRIQPSLVPTHLTHEVPPTPKQRQLSVTPPPRQAQPSVAPVVPTTLPQVAPLPRQSKLSGGSSTNQVTPLPRKRAPSDVLVQSTVAPIVQTSSRGTPQTQPAPAPPLLSKKPEVAAISKTVEPAVTPIVSGQIPQATSAPTQKVSPSASALEELQFAAPAPLSKVPETASPIQSSTVPLPTVASTLSSKAPDTASPIQSSTPSPPVVSHPSVALVTGNQEPGSTPIEIKSPTSTPPTQPSVAFITEMDSVPKPLTTKPATAPTSLSRPAEVTPAPRLTRASILLPPSSQKSQPVPAPRSKKTSILILDGPPEEVPVPKPRKPSTAPALQTPESKILPTLRPSLTHKNSDTDPKRSSQKRVSLAPTVPTRFCSDLFSSINENLVFISACNCALVLGIICCGLSALRASCLVINQ